MIIRDEHGNVRTTFDDMNPRIHFSEYRCSECGEWYHEDETMWFMFDGRPMPYCEDHSPDPDEL